jgi:predicted transcriptional regulator
MATSIKLPDALKRRVARVVAGTEQSVHAFMIEAIRQETERAEKRRSFQAAAVAARQAFRRDGRGYALADVEAHYRAKLTGRPARKPRIRLWPK